MRTADRSGWASLRVPPWRFLLSGTPWRAALYVTMTAVLGLVAVTPVLATWFVAPFWAVALARFERWRPVVLGQPRIPDPRRTVADRGGRLGDRLRDPLTWSEIGYLLVFVVFAAVSFAVVVLVLVAVTVAVDAATGGRAPADDVIASWLAATGAGRPVLFAGAMAVVVVALYAMAAIAVAELLVGRALLSGRTEQLAQRVEELTFSRRALLDGFDAERRRIERDLHDGAQQQLVALSMNIGLLGVELDAAEQEGADVRAARAALARVDDSAEHAVEALRASIRGIHPRVLVDHGIAAAVRELASRSPLPVRVDIDLGTRPPSRVETAAYFVVSEALTNASRYAGARTVTVTAGDRDREFWLEVVDDGVGGASPRTGGGLAGLRDRAAVLGGSFDVSSPPGGPTVLRFTAPTDDDERPRTGP